MLLWITLCHTSSSGRSSPQFCLKPLPEKRHENGNVSSLKSIHLKGAKITCSSWGLDPPNPQIYTFLETKRPSRWNPPLKHANYGKFVSQPFWSGDAWCWSSSTPQPSTSSVRLPKHLLVQITKKIAVPRLWGHDLRSQKEDKDTLPFIIHTHGQIALNSKPDWVFYNSPILHQTSGHKAATMKGSTHKFPLPGQEIPWPEWKETKSGNKVLCFLPFLNVNTTRAASC